MTKFEPLEIPSWIKWGQRKGARIVNKYKKGPNGRRLCGWCKVEVTPPRRNWCSDTCYKSYGRIWNWRAVAQYVIERDVVCVRCGAEDPPVPVDKYGKTRNKWDVDHILPVKDGGTDDPANLRLLCCKCHVEVGYEQRATRKLKEDKNGKSK